MLVEEEEEGLAGLTREEVGLRHAALAREDVVGVGATHGQPAGTGHVHERRAGLALEEEVGQGQTGGAVLAEEGLAGGHAALAREDVGAVGHGQSWPRSVAVGARRAVIAR